MALIKPFAALRPRPELAARLCQLPYDVMSSDEARRLAVGNPLSFLHVSKPEIDLPPATDAYAPEVYAKGSENFKRLLADGALRQDPQPCFYLYRQVMGRHTQVGLVAAASCQAYLDGLIKKHELTRPDKEDDRVRHIETLNSQTGPVFLVHRASKALDELVARQVANPPDIDFTADDGVRHTSWTVNPGLASGEDSATSLIADIFAQLPALYIADGHHRCAAAARVYQKRNPALVSPFPPDASACFLSVIFPHNQVQILPYNRVVKDLNGLSPAQVLEKLADVFVIQPQSSAHPSGATTPARKHHIGLYLDGKWYALGFHPRFTATNTLAEGLDATLLQNHVLDSILGITDPRTSKRINFVGGIRGAAELEKLVNSGDYACAFSLFPTSIEDLMAIADAGGTMPPKSTWFEPKLRDAMFCHLI